MVETVEESIVEAYGAIIIVLALGILVLIMVLLWLSESGVIDIPLPKLTN